MNSVAHSIKIMSDGASRGNPGPAGAGAVIEDESGTILGEVSEYLGERTNNAAEYSALILALESAQRFKSCKAVIRLDSQLLVEQIRGNYRVKSQDLRPLFERAKELLEAFPCYEITHVYRHENSRADELANKAIDDFKSGNKPSRESYLPEQEKLF
jgi:ribonuclease HI